MASIQFKLVDPSDIKVSRPHWHRGQNCGLDLELAWPRPGQVSILLTRPWKMC